MDAFEIIIEGTGSFFPCAAGQNVLHAMEQSGIKGIPMGCRGGGCGVCKVQVLDAGNYRTGKMSRTVVSPEDEKHGICLACKLYPLGRLSLRPMGILRRALFESST